MKLKKKKQKHSENKKPISYSEAKPSTEEDVLFEQMYGKPLNREDVEKEKNKKRPKKIKKEDGKKVKAVKRNTEEKNTAKLLPIKDVYNNAFVYTDNTLMDLLLINCKDLVSCSEDEVQNDIFNLNKFNKLYGDDYKIIGINFPTNTKSQQSYYQHKIANEKNPILREIQEEKLNELIEVEKQRTDREYYLMIFGKDIENLNSNRNIALNSLSPVNLIQTMTLNKKISILFKLANKSSAIFGDDINAEYVMKDDVEEQYQMLGYNPYLIDKIQPQGGISFKGDDYIRTGDGYEQCIRVYGYPSLVDRHWLTYVTNIPNAVTILDVSTYDSEQVKKNLNKGISEYKSREATAKNYAEASDAYARRNDMENIYEEVANYGEIIKEITCRIFVSDKVKSDLEKQVSKIMNYLEGNEYKSAVFLNETKFEWLSMYESATKQRILANKREGFPVASTTLAGGDPFHFTSLNDKYGCYYGTTTTSGAEGSVIFDAFASNNKRTSYNGLVFGRMGSGKSTLLKKLIRERAARGDFVRIFDVNGEFEPLAYSLGGKVVSLDGTSGILNPLQVNKTTDSESGSFSLHLSKLSTIYHFLAPESTHAERLEFENVARNLYIDCGIIPSENSNLDNLNITGLNAEAYPTFSDMLAFLDKIIKKEDNPDTKKLLVNISRVVKNICKTYGKIFDGHTSLTDFINTQVVVISIKNLTSEKTEVFDAQLFSALSLCWANAVKIGSQMKSWVENKRIRLEDAKRFLLVIDESHKTINSTKPFAVEQILMYAREGRKFFAGIYLASQSVRDYVPEGTGDEAFNKIKTLFEISQYKFIMNQDTNAVEMLEKIFEGQLTPTEIDSIPRLERGQAILCISGDKNINFNVEITDYELNIFKGGV